MSEEESGQKTPEKKKIKWLVPTITTLIGVMVSLAMGWYQINLSNEQALQAENERAKAVKNELTLIVEDHVINQKVIDIPRLSRLSELRAKQEKLLSVPNVSEIIETAEYNILSSQYLPFDKKEQYKHIFDEIYSKMYAYPLGDYDGLFKNSINELYASIQQGSTSDTLKKLNKVLADFNSEVISIQNDNIMNSSLKVDSFVKIIIEKPQIFISIIVIYLGLMLFLIRHKRGLLRQYKIIRKPRN